MKKKKLARKKQANNIKSNDGMRMSSRRLILGVLVIVLVTSAAYVPAMRGGFVWDDDAFVLNPIIKAGDGLYRFWFSTEPPDYFPLTSTTLWLEWRLWGENALGYHVVNVLLHVISSILIWLVLKRLKVPGAWLAGLIFAVHPVNVEAVAWITQRKSTLPLLFYFLSILLYLKFENTERYWMFALSIGSFLLALLSKTSVVMLPFVLLGCALWQRGKIVRRDVMRSIPFFVTSFILGLVTVWFQYNRSIGGDIVRTDSFLSRLAGSGWVVWFYLYKAIAPLKLSFVYPRWDIDDSSVISFLPLVLLIGLALVFWWYRRSWGRPFFVALGYFAVTLFPVMGFINIYFMRYSLVADHYQYQSIIGIIALLVGLGTYAYNGWQKKVRQLAIAAVVLIVGLLSLQTWSLGHIYKDQETLFHDTIAKNPRCWMAYYNMGHGYQRQGRVKESTRYYYEALRIQPDNVDPHNNMGNMLLEQGRVDEAIAHFAEALRIKPEFAEAHYNLGNALLEQGNLGEAIDHYYESLRIEPENAMGHNNLANALARQGRVNQAVPHYLEALRIKPKFTRAHHNLGIVLKRGGRFKEAIAHFSEVLRIKPDHVQARRSLEDALQLLGKSNEVYRSKAKP
jgi:tetratricopeptide (TPR) repeat protein